jgi:hypothetical protein
MYRISHAAPLDPKLIQPLIDARAKYKVIPALFDAKEMIAGRAALKARSHPRPISANKIWPLGY